VRDGATARAAARRRWWVEAAAAALLLALGAGAGALWARPGADPPPRYLLLLYPGTAAGVDAAAEAAAARDYAAWAGRLRADGRGISGERLADGADVVPAGRAAPDRDLQGFFVVTAESAEDARRVAAGSPHAARGGAIVIRRIDTP
jgi:hypothetical protein